MDEYRWQNDVQGSHSKEIGASFGLSNETKHLEALKGLNSRPSRKKNIRWLATAFILTANDQRKKVIEQLASFPRELPFTHEGQEQDDALDGTTFFFRTLELPLAGSPISFVKPHEENRYGSVHANDFEHRRHVLRV